MIKFFFKNNYLVDDKAVGRQVLPGDGSCVGPQQPQHLRPGLYKVPYSPLFGEEYQVVKRWKKYHGCREEYNAGNRKSNIIFPKKLRLLGRISSGEGGQETEILGKENKI